MAAEIKREFGIDSEIVRGSGGIFIVSVDGKPVFSKRDEGRFPTEREILDKLRA
ncbi:MAG: Rdx family protein [Acidobacteria bacterium]|nr:Rdx family protein [Acidobacteriota bacterium]MBV9184497.1 Rdx family protein [Acidobacteriota bacterium]